MSKKMQELLCSLNICDKSSIEQFFPQVRDRDDVAVLKCRKSGVIFLSRSDHMEKSHYENCADLKYWGGLDRKTALMNTAVDDQRRSDQFGEVVSGKIWLDVGTGLGGILDLLSPRASKTLAVEPQAGPRECLRKLGYQVYRDIDDVPDQAIETVSIFHVLEHFTEPLQTLRKIRGVMKRGGKIIIEVPHANDALLSLYDSEVFKAFTFWSEHLILHTRRSLTVFLEAAGFRGVTISGFQRYPLANHLYWLAKGKPGGHEVWNQLKTPALDLAYADLLNSIDQTDTLIAVAEA